MAGGTALSISSVHSIIMTASAPRGTTPPVAIAVAVPASTLSPGGRPHTRTSPLSRKRRGAGGHAPERWGGRHGFRRGRGEGQLPMESRLCLLGRNHLEELLLPSGV